MSSRTTNTSYTGLMDSIWMPTDETRARIERLEQLREMREGRNSGQNTNSETGHRLSARERFFQSYELPNWGRGGTEHQILTGAGSLSITREPRRSLLSEPRRNTLPEIPGLIDLRHSGYGEPVYEEPTLSEEEIAATYTPLAMFSEDPDDEADGLVTHRPQTSSRTAFIDNNGKAHWIEPFNPILKGHMNMNNRDEYIVTLTRSLQPKTAEQLRSLLLQWFADEAQKREEMGERMSPEGQFDDGNQGKTDIHNTSNLLTQKSHSVDDVRESYLSGYTPRNWNSSSANISNYRSTDSHNDSVDGSSQNYSTDRQSEFLSDSNHAESDHVSDSEEHGTRSVGVPRFSIDRDSRRVTLRRDDINRRIRRTGNVRRHISDVSGMHPTRIAGLYRSSTVIPDNDLRDSISKRLGEKDMSDQETVNRRGSEGNTVESLGLYSTAEPLIETDENESGSQPNSPRRYVSRTEIPTSPARLNQNESSSTTFDSSPPSTDPAPML